MWMNEEDVDYEDDNKTKKTSSKKGSNFMNQGQFGKTKVDDTEGDTSEEEAESSDDNYRFVSYNMT